jgi:hypothetical protein
MTVMKENKFMLKIALDRDQKLRSLGKGTLRHTTGLKGMCGLVGFASWNFLHTVNTPWRRITSNRGHQSRVCLACL